MDKNQARQTIHASIAGFRQYSAMIKSRVAVVHPDTVAERDEELSGSVLFPSAVVTGLMNAAADQIGGWAEMAGSRGSAQLHMLADYTLFRPIIEALTEVIWILDADNSEDRVMRSIDLSLVELKHGRTLTRRLRRAGTPDERIERSLDAMETHVKTSLSRLRVSQEDIAAKLNPRSPTIDPSEITRRIGRAYRAPSLSLNRYWGIASAHAHGQLITTLTFSVRGETGSRGGGYLHEPDEVMIAEILEVIQKLISTAAELLERRGYFLHP